jgi:hypothetical protein
VLNSHVEEGKKTGAPLETTLSFTEEAVAKVYRDQFG